MRGWGEEGAGPWPALAACWAGAEEVHATMQGCAWSTCRNAAVGLVNRHDDVQDSGDEALAAMRGRENGGTPARQGARRGTESWRTIASGAGCSDPQDRDGARGSSSSSSSRRNKGGGGGI